MDILATLLALDESLFFFINNLVHTPFLDQVFLFFSFYPLLIWMIIGLVVLVIEERKEKTFIIRLFLALTIAGLLASGVIKPIVRRPRPDITHGTDVVIVAEKPAVAWWSNDFAFPSGHAAVAFAGAYILMREETTGKHGKKHSRVRNKYVKIFFFIFALLTAFSRIYLGKHYPLDVVAGGLLGWGVGWMAWKLIDLYRPRAAY